MIIISHRGPWTFEARDDGSLAKHRGAGGVVSALGPLLTRGEPATWIAAALGDGDRKAAALGLQHFDEVALLLLDLDTDHHRLHYDLISNSVLWFLHHGMFDLPHRPRFDRRFHDAWEAYRAVNDEFARSAIDVAEPDDVVLVQDYQLALVPSIIATRRPELRSVLFTHTPFCGPNSIRVLPHPVATELCGAMARVRCGFHTTRWARAYEASVQEVLGHPPPGGSFASALAPDQDVLRETAASDEVRAARAHLDEVVGDRALIVRTDRIEPSKNIVRGFLAYDALLEKHEALRERVVFVAMLYASRDHLPEYLAYRNEVEHVAERINTRWATAEWTPIVVDTRDDYARSVAGLQRFDVLMVNPIKDGLNLVAKEGALLNERDGVICLSPEAGAFDELHDGVVPMHPYDVEAAADALYEALTMPAATRAELSGRVRALAGARTAADWLNDLVSEARPPQPQ